MAVSGQDSVNFTNQTASFVTRPGPVFVGGMGVPSSDTHLRLTGVAGDEATTPSATKYDQTATATFYVQVRVQLDDWTPAATQHLIGRLAVTASGTWRFGITSGGFPLLASTNNGTVTSSATSTVAVPARDGDTVWLRVIVSSTTSQASFYWAPDEPGVPSTWNTLSLNRSTATFPLQASTDPVEIGGRNNGTEPLAGRIYRARILDGSQVAIADFDPGTDWTGSSSWVASATGETWSLTGGATIVSTNPPAVTGTLAYTEDDDVVAMAGAETISGTLAYTEDDDTIAASGAENIPGTLAFTEDDDVIAASGTETISGTLAYTEDDDTWAATGAETVSGTLAYTEDDDVWLITSPSSVTGTLAYTEADDVIAASGTETFTGTLAFTEDDDTIAMVGGETITGTSAWTEADDTWAAAGAETITATAAWTEDDDTWLASGGISLAATLAWTEADDVWTASGGETIAGTLAYTEDDDVWAVAAFAGTPTVATGPLRTTRLSASRDTATLTTARVTLELADDRQTEAIR